MPSCTHSTQAPDGSQPARPNPIDEILYYTILATSLRSLLPPPVIIVSSPSPFSSSSPRPRPRPRPRARAAAHAFRVSVIRAPPRMHSARRACIHSDACPSADACPSVTGQIPRAAAHAFCVSVPARRRACILRVRDPARLRARVPRVTTERCTTSLQNAPLCPCLFIEAYSW